MNPLNNRRPAHRLAVLLSTLLVWAVVTSPVAGEQPETSRQVVVTIDDLPFTGAFQDLDLATRTTEKMVTALRAHRVPAVGFVTGSNVLVDGEVDRRLELLRRWRDGGTRLDNHSFSHRSFHRISVNEYLDDALLGQLFPLRIMAEEENRVRYYRHPFNHAGTNSEAQRRFAEFLDRHDLELAPFTVEHADYLFERLYSDALAQGDKAGAERIGQAYFEQLDLAFDFAEQLARDTFGRDIPQVFLIHSNQLNGVYLQAMLDRLIERGYRFVSLAEALADPAYATPTRYTGPAGISWLHRWRHHLDLEDRLRQEPDPPRWTLDAYRAMDD